MNTSESYDEFYVQIMTDKYAGNFERQMCAFITGQYGDCEVGEEESHLVPSHIQSLFADIIERQTDEHGCQRPCLIDYTATDAFKIFFHKKPNKKMMDVIQERAERFCIPQQSAELKKLLGLFSNNSHPTCIKSITIFKRMVRIKIKMMFAISE